ncbi:Uncharacterised protein [Mycobacteroides abscessus subsp. abscessus]|nr:Uncharacterised protein [Mycobacteroides abscessus subsp. abscessus]
MGSTSTSAAPSNSRVSSTVASPVTGVPSLLCHDARPARAVPVSSRMSGTRCARPLRARRAAPNPIR